MQMLSNAEESPSPTVSPLGWLCRGGSEEEVMSNVFKCLAMWDTPAEEHLLNVKHIIMHVLPLLRHLVFRQGQNDRGIKRP